MSPTGQTKKPAEFSAGFFSTRDSAIYSSIASYVTGTGIGSDML